MNTEANSYDALRECVLNVQAAAGNARHRGALVLSGDRGWSRQTVERLIGVLPFTHILWVGDDAPEGLQHRHSGRAHTVLGQEFDAVILDAWSGLDVDDLGALVGVIKAGGLLFLLCPPFAQWGTYADPAIEKMHIAGAGETNLAGRYIQRFIQVVESDDQVLLIKENADLPEMEVIGEEFARRFKPQEKTSDQAEAIDAIKTLAASGAPGAFVMIADRGRGKSSALGMAASEIVQDETSRIILTAPRFAAVSQVYEYFRGLEEQLQFVAPDELLRNPRSADLLMIDEAAAIPVQILVSLLEYYPRVVFATTVHGYEGSGRGFEIRFSSLLSELRPGWKKLDMHQPVRWSEGDPLESFSFRSLLLDAQPAILEKQSVHASECSYVQLSRDELVDNESRLREVFGLLVMAHYRTRPFDLRYLLDAPDVEIHALLYEGHVVAVVMISTEGGFDVETSDAIYAGVRRPRGHLLAQSLAAHCGVELAPVYRYARIVRIAVHPEVQGQGLGSRLLEEVTRTMHASGYVALGASFAADTRVMRFWRNHHFSPVHVGVKREHTTGSYPMLVLRPLGQVGEQVYQEALSRFVQRYRVLREAAYADIDADIRVQLDEVTSVQTKPLAEVNHELLAFVYAHRGLELSLYAIRGYLERKVEHESLLLMNPSQAQLVQECIWQLHPLTEVAQRLGLSGKREAVQMLRNALAEVIEHESAPEMMAYRQQLLSLKAAV